MKKESMKPAIKQPVVTPKVAASPMQKLHMDYKHPLHMGKVTSGPKGDSNGSR